MIPKCEALRLEEFFCLDVFDGHFNGDTLAAGDRTLFVACLATARRGITSENKRECV